jgi:RpiB/LacA/LacB family sugar-phosphate isomerase
MVIYLGADHGGVGLKEKLKEALQEEGYEIIDFGAFERTEGDDYPDFGVPVAEKVSLAPDVSRGILICRSGFGMDIVANKFPGVRAMLPVSPDHAYQGRHDDDANILCFAADFTDEATALKIVKVFLSTPFAKEERYARRLEKISNIESENQK